MTNSVKAELIPWTTEHLDKKKFNWTLAVIDEKNVQFNFFFEHPLFISQNAMADTMKITFENTPFYIVPQDSSKLPIPNGYPLMIKMPPEVESFVETMEVTSEGTKTSLLTVIAANGWLSFLFGISMQPLFDMINSLQITALLPLTNLQIPANVMILFEVLM